MLQASDNGPPMTSPAVGVITDGGPRPALRVPRFVGRDQELAALAQALAQPHAIVLIEGEAGIGKTRLLAEYLATLADEQLRMLVVRCPPFRQPQTLGPVVDALRQATGALAGLALSALAGALRPLFPEWAADLPPAPEPAEDATAARHRVFRALAELLDCLGVTVLAAEDVHWADDATLEFLLFLATRQPRPLSVVVSCRPEDLPDGSLLLRLTSRMPPGAIQSRLTLGPLGVGATAELVSSMLAGESVTAAFATFLHAHTEGVPLAIEESIRLMRDRADLTSGEHGWVRRHLTDIAVPATIRDAVLERASRLDDAAQDVLRAAAVLTDPADEAILAAVTELPPQQLRAGLSAALATGLLCADDRGLVSFRHMLAARAVYEAIADPQRRAMHLRAGQALEAVSPPAVARLARHFGEARETGRWCRYGEQAAELAVASGDDATALVLLSDLITGAGPVGLSCSLRVLDKMTFASLIQPVRHLGRLIRCLREMLAAGKMTGGEEGVVRSHVGMMLFALDEYDESRAELERAIPNLAHDPARAARAMVALGWPVDTTSPSSVHLRWLERAASLAPSLPPVAQVRLLVDRSTALRLLGEAEGWAEAAKLPVEPASAQERQLIALSHLNAGDSAMIWGRYALAESCLARALELADSRRYPRFIEGIEVTKAHLDWFTGAWTGLADRVNVLTGDAEGQPLARQEAALVIGLLQAATGEPAMAEERFRLVLAERLRRGGSPFAMEPAGALGRLLLRDGRVAEALTATSEPAAIMARKAIWVHAAEIIPARVAALAAAAQTDEAARIVTAFGRGLRGRDAPAARAALIVCRAVLAEARHEQERAARLFLRAAQAWQALPRPYDALLAREWHARCLLAMDQQAAGLAVLSEVMLGLSKLGATGDAQRVARTLRENGLRVRRPGAGRPAYRDRLSPRELEVIRLVANGRTNRQIASVLHVSPRTVATHVDSAMRKLKAASRTAMVVSALSAGVIARGEGQAADP